MITLPTLATTAATGDADTVTSALGGKSGDAAQDFLALLGQRLGGLDDKTLSLADGKTLSLAQLPADAKSALKATLPAGLDAAALPTDTDLQSLLAKLLPGAQPVTDAADGSEAASGDSAAKQQDGDAAPLSTGDLSALSALFAMLGQNAQPAPTAKATQSDEASSLTLNAAALNAAQIILPAAASGGNGAKSDVKSEFAKPEAGRDARAESTGLSAASAAAAQTVAADAVAPARSAEKGYNDGNSTHALASLTHATSAAHVSSATTASAPAAAAAPQVTAQLGTPAWEQSVSQHVTMFTRQGQQSAELRLHPEDLGAVQISLKIDDNTAQLQMTSPHSHVRAALEAALPTLRAQLAENGIQLGQSSISSDSSAGQQQASQQQQQGGGSRGAFSFPGAEEDAVAAPVSLQSAARGGSAVDIFA